MSGAYDPDGCELADLQRADKFRGYDPEDKRWTSGAPRFPPAVSTPLWTFLCVFSAGGREEHPTTRSSDRARPLSASQPAAGVS